VSQVLTRKREIAMPVSKAKNQIFHRANVTIELKEVTSTLLAMIES
jgi:hypothetical protein